MKMEDLSTSELIDGLNELKLHPGGTRARMIKRIRQHMQFNNLSEDSFIQERIKKSEPENGVPVSSGPPLRKPAPEILNYQRLRARP